MNKDSKGFLFSESCEEDIIIVISAFKTSKGSGPGNIPKLFMKIAVPIIAKPLAFLFNSSLFQVVFPKNGTVQGCPLCSRMVLLRSYLITDQYLCCLSSLVSLRNLYKVGYISI